MKNIITLILIYFFGGKIESRKTRKWFHCVNKVHMKTLWALLKGFVLKFNNNF